ncbi:uncharacterized protein [Rutidosis leptorrhynchoides]|uniref:uncharacterized protein n=1 Tax=Rutidosis leptorrhynchoides TaxID=125765 RepID=UPI003A9A3320
MAQHKCNSFRQETHDHCPIVLKDGDIDFRPKPIKVFDEWIKHKGAFEVVKSAWSLKVNSKKPDCIFRDKLKNVKQELQKWYSTSQGKLKVKIDELTKVVTDWETKAKIINLNEDQHENWMKYRETLLQKEKTHVEMLKQKAIFKWVLEGDENSKFFHSCIRRRQHKNNIHGVNAAGIWTSKSDDIKSEQYKYFKGLFEKNDTETFFAKQHGRAQFRRS